MLPSREEAERMLAEGEKRNPGPWGNHSRTVAKSAEKIAQQVEELDPQKAYIVGLLHDIGRREGVTYIAHVIDGYDYLMKQGFDEPAKICITHSFALQNIEHYIGKRDITEEKYERIKRLLDGYEYDDYDRLIQLCDSIAFPEGVVELKIRMDDVEQRYGYYPPEKRKVNYEIKEYFEKKMGKNLYEVVSDDQSLWGL